MSQDLFAAFGDPVQELHNPAAAWSDSITPTATINQVAQPDDDDDFGDFEDASAPTAAPPVPPKNETATVKAGIVKHNDPSARLPFKPRPKSPARPQANAGRHPFADHMDVLFDAGDDEYNAGQDEWNDLSNNPEAAVAYSKRVIQEQLEAEARAKQPASTPQTTVKPLPVTMKPKNLDVLFDADDLSDGEPAPEDDWGDFEETNIAAMPVQARQRATPPATTILPSMDLLGLDDPPPQPKPSAPIKNKVSPQRAMPRPVSQPAEIAEDPWDDFDDSSSQNIVTAPAKSITPQELQSLATPTNIPPPSVLLSQLAASLKSTPTTSNVSALLLHAWVLGHVLAGRKLRWKRSATLAASMRIGPAAAGGKSGMKLTGIDRGEVTKEDREVAEALAAWRAQVGKIRPLAAHAGGNNRKAPDLTETIPVRSLKAVDGGFVAARECALCGLKREERAGKLDEDVQDSFGEWWVDNASMHTGCAEWWVVNESLLRSR